MFSQLTLKPQNKPNFTSTNAIFLKIFFSLYLNFRHNRQDISSAISWRLNFRITFSLRFLIKIYSIRYWRFLIRYVRCMNINKVSVIKLSERQTRCWDPTPTYISKAITTMEEYFEPNNKFGSNLQADSTGECDSQPLLAKCHSYENQHTPCSCHFPNANCYNSGKI